MGFGRGALLWLIGIPLPIILLLAIFMHQYRNQSPRRLLFSRGTCGRRRTRDLPRRQARRPWVHQERRSRGIRINAICPGLIWTPMADQMVAAGQGDARKAMEKSVPMGRVGLPEEIANAVLCLCQRRRQLRDWPVDFGGRRALKKTMRRTGARSSSLT
jgi:hypothetical protein